MDKWALNGHIKTCEDDDGDESSDWVWKRGNALTDSKWVCLICFIGIGGVYFRFGSLFYLMLFQMYVCICRVSLYTLPTGIVTYV